MQHVAHRHSDEIAQVNAEIERLRAELGDPAYTRVLKSDVDAQNAEIERLRAALAFAASVIKCGEPWSQECDRIIGGALQNFIEDGA